MRNVSDKVRGRNQTYFLHNMFFETILPFMGNEEKYYRLRRFTFDNVRRRRDAIFMPDNKKKIQNTHTDNMQ